MSEPFITTRKDIVSHCCGSTIMADSDICDGCKDHCEGEITCDLCDGEKWVEVIDEAKVNSATIDIPYKKVECPKCKGEGYLVIEIEI